MNHLPPTPVYDFIEVGRHRIAVVDGRAEKSGPPLVFVHGIAMSVRLWPEVIKGTPLDEFPWISLGLPAHFPSGAPVDFQREDVTVELFAECVAKPVRAYFGGQPAHLIGWSTGGFASLAAAALHPDIAATVVSISGFARGRWGSHLSTMQFLARRRLGKGFLRMVMSVYARFPRMFRGFVRALAKQKLEVSDELMAMLFEDFGQHDRRAMCELMAGIRDLDLSPTLAAVQVPVIVLSGERDKVVRAKETQHLLEQLPTARHVDFPGVGHIFFAEAPAEYLNEIVWWIETREHQTQRL